MEKEAKYKQRTREYLEFIKNRFVEYSEKKKISRIDLPYIELLLTRSKIPIGKIDENFTIEFNNILINTYAFLLKKQYKNKVKLKYIIEKFDFNIKNI